MKPKSLLLVISCLFFFTVTFGQRKKIYFFKNSGELVVLQDSADFTRVVSEPDSGSTLFNVLEYYKNGNKKFVGKSSTVDPLRLEGLAETYSNTGKKYQTINYTDGQKIGDAYTYFPNGKLYTHKQYIKSDLNPNTSYEGSYLIIDCIDSTGKVLTVNGDGYYVGYNDDFKNIYEEGNLKAGLRVGSWKGGYEHKSTKIAFKEDYDNGKLISGQSVDENNQTYNYTIREVQPQFPNGIQSFYKFLSQNIRYPASARQKNIYGKVIISFVIEKDGSLTGLKVLRNPYDDLTTEALRVIKLSPNWIPGLQFGKAVRVSYTVPVAFRLGGN